MSRAASTGAGRAKGDAAESSVMDLRVGVSHQLNSLKYMYIVLCSPLFSDRPEQGGIFQLPLPLIICKGKCLDFKIARNKGEYFKEFG